MIDLERIKNIANRISAKYNLKVPVDLNVIVNDCCKYIETDDTKKADGYTDLSTIPPTIYINNKIDYIPRVRFTIAHELGHIFIPWHNGSTTYTDSKSNTKRLIDKNEAEADAFASELLLPTTWVKEQIQKYRDMKSLISNVMQASNTSFIATLRAIISYIEQPVLIYYALPDWEYWQVLTNKSVNTFGFWYTESDNLVNYSKLIDYCKDEESSFNINSYEVMCKRLISLPTNIANIYDNLGDDLSLLFNELSSDQPIKILPFIDDIINSIKSNYIVLIKLKDYRLKFMHSKNIQQTIYPYNEDFLSFKNKLLNIYHNCKSGDISFGEIGDLFWLKVEQITIPVCSYSDPNTLLSDMIKSVYAPEMFDTIWRKINGVLGGTNNIKNKGTPDEFFELLFNRIRLKNELLPLTKHPRFKEFLINKIKQISKNSN